ncbi:MAG: CRTAC1 family protein [Planctomycetota bacterium]
MRAHLDRRIAATLVALLLAGCGKDDPSSDPSKPAAGDVSDAPAWFVEEAAARGIDFVHRCGHRERFLFPELMGGGVALFDKDGDGDLDAFLVQSGSLTGEDVSDHRLYENAGDGTFRDVTDAAGIRPGGYGMGVATGDYDGDGDVDLYVTCVGPNRLLENDGAGRFTDVTEAAGVGDPGWGTSAAFVDIDGDGRLDLFVTNYVEWSIETEKDCFTPTGQPDYCGPMAYESPARDTLYLSNGDGTFTDASVAMGLDASFGNGLGVVPGDFDGDGRMDVFVANDQTPDNLWTHGEDGRLADVAERAGCARDPHGGVRAGMGVDAADVDGDDDLDLLVVHMAREQDGFYRNRGRSFVEETRRVGIGMGTYRMTRFGVGFHDFDADGWLDLFVANGRVNLMMAPLAPGDVYAEPNSVLRGSEDGRWSPIELAGGTAEPLLATSRGAAFGDVDGDGAMDVLVGNREGPAHLFRNVAPNRGHWLIVRLVDGSATAVGASARVTLDGRTMRREIKPAYSYCSASDARAHFGLGDVDRIEEVVVRWPDGAEETFGAFEADRVVEIVRGSGR